MNWLKNFPLPPSSLSAETTPSSLARMELENAFPGGDFVLTAAPSMGDSFVVDRTGATTILTGGETGLLYGAYTLIRHSLSWDPRPVIRCA